MLNKCGETRSQGCNEHAWKNKKNMYNRTRMRMLCGDFNMLLEKTVKKCEAEGARA